MEELVSTCLRKTDAHLQYLLWRIVSEDFIVWTDGPTEVLNDKLKVF